MVYIVVGLVGLLALFVTVTSRQEVYAAWQEEAGRLGLRFTGGGLRRSRMSGEIRGLSVTVETFSDGEDTATRISVEGGRLPHSIELESEGSYVGVRRLLAREDILVGAPSFDALVRVTGVESIALAVLGEEMRRSVLALVGSGGKLQGGRVFIERSGTLSNPGAITRDAELLLQLAEKMPHAPPERLLQENAAVDVPGVRRRNLEVLAAQYPDTPEMKAAAEVALGDADASVRLLGATLVRGERGKAVLRGLLAEKLDEALLAQAVRTAAATGDASFGDAVLALAPRTEPALAEAVANALGKIGDAKMESALLRLVNRPDLAVKRAAAAALGLVGTVRAVEPLLFEEQGTLGHAARDAVRRIQARLVDADAGRVSLAPQQSGSGALSIAPQGGELSEAPLHGKISS